MPDDGSLPRPRRSSGTDDALRLRPGKRRAFLAEVAQSFEPGRRYEEREVNDTLRRYHPDTAALRRYLVDEGFLDRDHGLYWRSGGPFDVD